MLSSVMGDDNGSPSEFNYRLQGLRYSETRASKPPVQVTRSTSSLHREFDKPPPSPSTGDTASLSSNKRYNPHASLPQDGAGPRIQAAGPESISARESQTSTTLSLNTRTPTV